MRGLIVKFTLAHRRKLAVIPIMQEFEPVHIYNKHYNITYKNTNG